MPEEAAVRDVGTTEKIAAEYSPKRLLSEQQIPVQLTYRGVRRAVYAILQPIRAT